MSDVTIQDLVGRRIVACRGFETDRRRKKNVDTRYILFDDSQTYIELEEQDYYTYHDCSSSARHVRLHRDPQAWLRIMDNERGYYPEATEVAG